MTMCLLTDAWLPVRRLRGTSGLISPAEITSTQDDPPVALDWPRPDFRLAATEFLIGLFATAAPPASDQDWVDLYREPPDARSLRAAFAPFAEAFVLDGDGPRFMQDMEDFTADPNPVGTLLIEAPGENTIKRNTDLMVHRGRVGVLSRAAAAMALFALQTYAPSGGAGNRTSLRGGGPLTTLAIPPPIDGAREPLLWHLLWANVPLGAPPDRAEWPRVFPWLAPTRTSEKNAAATTPADTHRLQAWWGMPRRIRLDFSTNPQAAACNLTGAVDDIVVRTWRQRPWGISYRQWGRVHPLSPCRREKPDAEWVYLHPQPGGIGYQHWLALLSSRANQTRAVAPAVALFRGRVRDIARGREPWRLLAAGYDMDNMKARGFAESEMPVWEPSSQAAAQQLDALVEALITAANVVAGLLARCVRRALFFDGAGVSLDTASLAALRERFWADTADAFFAIIERAGGGAPEAGLTEPWRRTLDVTARRLFDEAAPMDATAEGHPNRIAAAARQLDFALRGFGKDGETLFTVLGLAVPEVARKLKQHRGGKAA